MRNDQETAAADDSQADTEPLGSEAPIGEPDLNEATETGTVDTSDEVGPDGPLAENIQRLNDAVEKLIKLREKDQQIAERLHKENEELRLGEVREVQRPLLSDIARLVDLVAREVGSSAEERSRLDFLKEGLTEVLASAGVEELPAEPGDSFERGLHKAVERVPTTDEAQSGRISDVRRIGFGWTDGTVLRPTDVAVFIFESDEQQPVGHLEDSSEVDDHQDQNETESEGEE